MAENKREQQVRQNTDSVMTCGESGGWPQGGGGRVRNPQPVPFLVFVVVVAGDGCLFVLATPLAAAALVSSCSAAPLLFVAALVVGWIRDISRVV